MKKRFLLISMFAAAMLATSCSKDDNEENQTVEPQPVTVQVQKTYPITVKATKKSSVSKISLGSNGYSELFEIDDKLVLTWGTDGSVELGLTGGEGTTSATFSGEIPETANGQTVTAHIGSPIIATTKLDYTSLEDAVKNACYLVSQESFTYTAGANIPQITLDDQNSYLHFKLAATQLKFDLNIDGSTRTFSTFDENNEVWIVVPGGKTIKGNLISVSGKTLDAAKVYTVDRTNVVDLGSSFTCLWATCNLGASNPGDFGNHYAWAETTTKSSYNFSTYKYGTSRENLTKYNSTDGKRELETSDDPAHAEGGWRMPVESELTTLCGQNKTWEIQDGHNGYKFYTDYGSVFLPAAGHYSGTEHRDANDHGSYLTSTLLSDDLAHCYYMTISSTSAEISKHIRPLGGSVRPVRYMN